MSSIVKFPYNHKFFGYGFDFDNNKIVSYKIDFEGRLLQFKHQYSLNGISTCISEVKEAAQNVMSEKKNNEFILFSSKLKVSHYFTAGTKLEQAIAVLEKRGIKDFHEGEFKVLFPSTQKIVPVVINIEVKYTYSV